MRIKTLLLTALLYGQILQSQSYTARVYHFCTGEPLEDVALSLSGVDAVGDPLEITAFSDATGAATFNAASFAPNSALRLSASATTLASSTFDLVLLEKHLLGEYDFTHPYQWIAADVNADFGVNIADRVALAGLWVMPPSGGNWRFFPKNFSFTNPALPLNDPFPSDITFTQGAAPELELYGVQLGDVSRTDCSALSFSPEISTARLTVAPNPTHLFWQLTFTETATDRSVQLTDLTGRLISETNAQEAQAQVPCAHLPAGMYTLYVREAAKPDRRVLVVKQ
jgi:hypothetical protein